MAEESPQIQGESSKASRRGFLTKMGILATGLVGGVAAAREVIPKVLPEKKAESNIENHIRGLSFEDIDRPESEKFKGFIGACASEYLKLAGIQQVAPNELIQKTIFHKTQQEFRQSVTAQGFTVADNDRSFGIVTYKSGNVNMNLELLREVASAYTRYPGIMIFRWLVHEWGDLLAKDNSQGVFLNNPSEILTDESGKNPEAWEKYRGGMIITKSYTGLFFFDNAWNDLATRRLIMKSLQAEDLKAAAIPIIADSGYFQQANYLGRILELTGIDIPQSINLHSNSKVEDMFKTIGSVFEESVLSEISDFQKGGRNEDQLHQDKDFLVGKRIAFLVNGKHWEAFGKMLPYIKKSS